MWSLKYEYRHKDCLYTHSSFKQKVKLLGQPISCYKNKDALIITAIQTIEGEPSKVKRYINYLKKVSEKIEPISLNSVFTRTIVKKNLNYYDAMYNQKLFYPRPIIHENNMEHVQVMSWDKENLTKLYNVIKNNPYTEYFKVLHFKKSDVNNIFIMKIINNLTTKQRAIFDFASQNGYYNYPRKINLAKISKNFRISKSTCHEILRRAETNILNEMFNK